MRIIVRIAALLGFIAALVYGALWGYSWYKVKQNMDEAIAQAAPFAEIRYASIFASFKLDGTVGVDRLVIKPKMTTDEFKIQSVRITFPGVFPLLTSEKDELPESMRLVISGITLDLNSPLLVSLGQMQKEAQKIRSKANQVSLVSFDTLGCGDVKSMGLDELISMGYQTIDIDIDLEYGYAKLKNLLTLSAIMRMKGMQGVDIKTAMRIPPDDLAHGNFSNLVIDSVRVEVIDTGYAVLRNRYCAAQLQATEEMFLGKNLEILSRELGTTFPLETIDAYKKVMQGGRMSFEIAPNPGTEFATLDRFAMKDIVDILGLKLTLDSHVVDFNKFEWGKSYSVVRPDGSKEEEKQGTPATLLPIAKPAHVPATYHATAPAKLSRYVDHKVRLKTRTGLDRDGIITEAEAGTITVRQTASAGKGFITFSIAVNDITSAEVLY